MLVSAEVEVVCSLADWGSELLPPQKSSRGLGRSVHLSILDDSAYSQNAGNL